MENLFKAYVNVYAFKYTFSLACIDFTKRAKESKEEEERGVCKCKRESQGGDTLPVSIQCLDGDVSQVYVRFFCTQIHTYCLSKHQQVMVIGSQ